MTGCSRTRNASSRSSLTPRPREAMTGTTGTPSRAASFAASILIPFFSARSSILSATTIGRPSSMSSSVNSRLRPRMEASTTLMTRSGFSENRCLRAVRLGRIGRAERVGARKVDDVEEPPLDGDPAVGVLDGRPRKVRGLGLQPGDGVEQRALAAVGLADEDDRRNVRGGHPRPRP